MLQKQEKRTAAVCTYAPIPRSKILRKNRDRRCFFILLFIPAIIYYFINLLTCIFYLDLLVFSIQEEKGISMNCR